MKIKNMTTLHSPKSLGRSLSWRCGFVLVPLALACFALVQNTQAVSPPPDGGYPGATTAEGDNALLSLTSGLANTAVGNGALRDTTTGGFNVAVGSRALASNITGSFNMAIERRRSPTTTPTSTWPLVSSGFMNTTGNHLTGIGAAALRNNTTAGFNTAIGADADAGKHIGAADNTAIGADALTHNIVGGSNTAVGRQALENNDSTTMRHSAPGHCRITLMAPTTPRSASSDAVQRLSLHERALGHFRGPE